MSDEVVSEAERYEHAWRRLEGSNHGCMGTLLLGFLLVCFVGRIFLPAEGERSSPVVTFVGLGWMASLAYTAYRRHSLRCPRCGERFFIRDSPHFHNHFADQCVNCGLPMWADAPEG